MLLGVSHSFRHGQHFGEPHTENDPRDACGKLVKLDPRFVARIVGNCNDAGSLERQVLGCPHNVHSELHGTCGTIETPAKNVRAATLSSPANSARIGTDHDTKYAA